MNENTKVDKKYDLLREFNAEDLAEMVVDLEDELTASVAYATKREECIDFLVQQVGELQFEVANLEQRLESAGRY